MVTLEDTGIFCAAVGDCKEYQAEVTGASPHVPVTETTISPPPVRVVGPSGSTESIVGGRAASALLTVNTRSQS